MKARTVADVIVREIIIKFGVPPVMDPDQEKEFERQLFSELCKMLKSKKARRAPFHPHSAGLVERFNQTLFRMLQNFVNEHLSEWDDCLPFVTMTYRSVEHETSGCSPNY